MKPKPAGLLDDRREVLVLADDEDVPEPVERLRERHRQAARAAPGGRHPGAPVEDPPLHPREVPLIPGDADEPRQRGPPDAPVGGAKRCEPGDVPLPLLDEHAREDDAEPAVRAAEEIPERDVGDARNARALARREHHHVDVVPRGGQELLVDPVHPREDEVLAQDSAEDFPEGDGRDLPAGGGENGLHVATVAELQVDLGPRPLAQGEDRGERVGVGVLPLRLVQQDDHLRRLRRVRELERAVVREVSAAVLDVAEVALVQVRRALRIVGEEHDRHVPVALFDDPHQLAQEVRQVRPPADHDEVTRDLDRFLAVRGEDLLHHRRAEADNERHHEHAEQGEEDRRGEVQGVAAGALRERPRVLRAPKRPPEDLAELRGRRPVFALHLDVERVEDDPEQQRDEHDRAEEEPELVAYLVPPDDRPQVACQRREVAQQEREPHEAQEPQVPAVPEPVRVLEEVLEREEAQHRDDVDRDERPLERALRAVDVPHEDDPDRELDGEDREEREVEVPEPVTGEELEIVEREHREDDQDRQRELDGAPVEEMLQRGNHVSHLPCHVPPRQSIPSFKIRRIPGTFHL